MPAARGMVGPGPARPTRTQTVLGGDSDQTQLLQGGDVIVEPDFLKNLAVLQLENGHTGESHRTPGIRGQSARQKISKRGSCMRSATLPAADHIVAVRNEICCPPEVKVGKGLAEIRHECLDPFPSPTRLEQ